MKSASATAMSAEWLRDRNYLVERTEQTVRIPDKEKPGKWKVWKKDLWTFADLTAVNPKVLGTLYVQCSIGLGSHKTDRQEKINNADATRLLLRAGNQIELHLWRKLKENGRPRWTLARFTAFIQPDTDNVMWRDDSEVTHDEVF